MNEDAQWQKLLDGLEDAQENYARARRVFVMGFVACLIGTVVAVGAPILLSFLHSIGADWGWGSMFIPVFGLLLAIAGGALAGTTWFDQLPGCRRQVKLAERAHRDALLRGPTDR